MDASEAVELPLSAALSFNCNIAVRCPSEQEVLHSIAVRLRLPFDPPPINVPFDSSVLSTESTSYARGLLALPPISSPSLSWGVTAHHRGTANRSSRKAGASVPQMLAEAVRAVGRDVPAHVRTGIAAKLLRSCSPKTNADYSLCRPGVQEPEDYPAEFVDSTDDTSDVVTGNDGFERIRRAEFVGENVLLNDAHYVAAGDRHRADDGEEGDVVCVSHVHLGPQEMGNEKAASDSARVFVGLQCGAVVALPAGGAARERTQYRHLYGTGTATAVGHGVSTEQALVVALLARASGSSHDASRRRHFKDNSLQRPGKFDRASSKAISSSSATILGYHRGAVTCVGYDDATSTVYTGSADGCLCVWDAAGGVAGFGAATGAPGALPRSSVYSGESRGTRRRGSRSEDAQASQFVEMVRRRALIQCINAHDATVSAARHYACNMFTGSVDKTVKLWRRPAVRRQTGGVADLALCHVFCFSSWVRSIAFSGGSEKAQPLGVYVSDSQGTITLMMESVARPALEDDVSPSVAAQQQQQQQRHGGYSGTQFRVVKTCSTSSAKDSIWDNRSLDVLSTFSSDTSTTSGPRAIMKLLSIEEINTIVTLGFDSVITLYEASTMNATQCVTLPTSSMALGSEKGSDRGRRTASHVNGDSHTGIIRIVDVLFLPLSERLVVLESNGHLLLWDMETCSYMCECVPKHRLHPRALLCADVVSRKQRKQRPLAHPADSQNDTSSHEQDGFWIQTDRSVEHIRIEECFIARRRKGHTGSVVGIACPRFGAQGSPLGTMSARGGQTSLNLFPQSAPREVGIPHSAALGPAYVSMSAESTVCVWNERLDVLQADRISAHIEGTGVPLNREQPELSCMLYCSEWGGVMTGHTDGTIMFTSVDAGGVSSTANPRLKHRVHTNTVSDACIVFMTQSTYHSNTHLATVSFDGYLGVWTHPEKPSIRRLARVRVSFSELVAVAFSELNQVILVGDNTGVLSTWSATPSGIFPACVLMPTAVSRGAGLMHRIPFRPTSVVDLTTHIRAPHEGVHGASRESADDVSEYTCAAAHEEAISSIVVDGNFALSGSEDGEVHLWNLSTYTCVRVYRIKDTFVPMEPSPYLVSRVQNDEVRCMVLLHNAECMVVGTRMGCLYVFDLDEEAPIAMHRHVCEVTALCAAHSSVHIQQSYPSSAEKLATPDRLVALTSSSGIHGVIVGDSSGALSYAAFDSFVKMTSSKTTNK